MNLGAIDIGSNAVRLLIQETTETPGVFRKISLTRVPLRLGEDVFSGGKISKEKAKSLVKVMKAFRLLMEVNDVVRYRACATSAMREAVNGEAVADLIRENAKIPLELISGKEEANLIFSNFHSADLSDSKTYLYIDVGGGSTEVTLIKNNERIKSSSFKLGTVRILKNKVDEAEWKRAKDFVKSVVKEENEIITIGTGGNINRIYKETRHSFGEMVSYDEIKKIVDLVGSYTFEERINKLKLKPDRADVIIPAGKIYLTLMKSAKSKKMIVPKVGLSDGIIYNLSKELA